ncbi:MAG: hypothetical protein IJI66_00925 [Erysipelotrichaceae bacterium]|nr:hypothetical protein [Erysipelotrichaceae bacterium]
MSNKAARRNITAVKNVYVDNNRLIYYDPLTKKAHQITKGDEKSFILFQMGTPAACIIAGLIAYFTENYYLAIAIGVLIALAVYCVFRFVFIGKLPEYPKFNVPEKTGMLDRFKENNSRSKLLTNSIVMLVIGIMLIFNIISQKYSGSLAILNYIISGVFFVVSIICFLAFLSKKE